MGLSGGLHVFECLVHLAQVRHTKFRNGLLQKTTVGCHVWPGHSCQPLQGAGATAELGNQHRVGAQESFIIEIPNVHEIKIGNVVRLVKIDGAIEVPTHMATRENEVTSEPVSAPLEGTPDRLQSIGM